VKTPQASSPASTICRWLPVALLFLATSSLGPDFHRQKTLAAETKDVVLLYEVDPDTLQKGQKVNMDFVIRAINRRLNPGSFNHPLNPGWFRHAQVRKTDKQQIEITLPEGSKLDKKQVERLLACNGHLEFRILANNRDNKDTIEQALANPSKTVVLDENAERAAWWVPVKEEEAKSIAAYPDIAVRTRKKAEDTITEVLLVPDEYNVTGEYLSHVAVDSDDKGQPCIRFTFNKKGGRLFAALTGSHLPDEVDNHLNYKLAIIIDGVVYSAPAIQSTIREHGTITGTFNKEQCEELVRVLDAGTLPAEIRPVKKQQGK
jgi:SecD/SecF fusion protein